DGAGPSRRRLGAYRRHGGVRRDQCRDRAVAQPLEPRLLQRLGEARHFAARRAALYPGGDRGVGGCRRLHPPARQAAAADQAAVLYALLGSILTYALGGGLIEAGNVRQAREADLRSVLIRARENAEGNALMRGEPDERMRLRGAMSDLHGAWHAQTRGQGSLA